MVAVPLKPNSEQPLGQKRSHLPAKQAGHAHSSCGSGSAQGHDMSSNPGSHSETHVQRDSAAIAKRTCPTHKTDGVIG